MAVTTAVRTVLLLSGLSAGQLTDGFQPQPREAPPATGYPGCDALIAAGLTDRVFFPPDAEYNSSISSYWSGTVRQLHPWCIVKPESTEDVSKAFAALVKTSQAGNWDIAVRGGGHSHFANNNVAQGVTIDLTRMNLTVYNSENRIASIGPGARWRSVYKEIEKYGQTVTGGREGNVGVAGLTLGGGASFHTGTRGFACDDVVNYQVVLADGSIADTNVDENVDLFRALKGGSNNFGIVTRFDMRTFDAAPGGLYGGILLMSYENRQAVMEQFVRLIDINEENPHDTEVVTFTYAGEGPAMIAVSVINTAGVNNSTSFAPLEGLPVIMDGRERKTYGTLITDYVTVGGGRTVWFSLCFQNDMEIMTKMSELFDSLIDELKPLIPAADLAVSFVSQPLPKHFATKGSGNNVLGLDNSLTHDSIVWLAMLETRTGEQEAIASAKAAAMTADLEAYAEARGKVTRWRYLNYVNPAQDPISTYGEDNVKFLKEVAAKYDPTGVFQTRVPGGFKVSRVQI